MSDNLSELLVDLASNADRMAAFQADPERVFDEAGLSSQERAVMRSRDPRLLADTVGAAQRLMQGHAGGAAKKKGGRKKSGRKSGAKKGGAKKKGGKKR
jgi:hypothetical protein